MIASFQQLGSMPIWPVSFVLIMVLTVLAVPTAAILKWAWNRYFTEEPKPKNWLLVILWATYGLVVAALGALAAADVMFSRPAGY